MKTILYLITQSEFGGAQRYVFDLAMNLKNEFNICVGMGEEGKNGEFIKKLEENNIQYYILKNLKREISPINDFLAIFEIIKLIKKLKPDIIHLNSSKISILGSLATFFIRIFAIRSIRIFTPLNSASRLFNGASSRIRIMYTVHGWVFNEPLPKWKKLFYFLVEKFTSYFKDKIICISKLDYDIGKNQLKIPEKKLSLIYHGIKPINFLSREEAREKIEFPPLIRGGKGGWHGATPPHLHPVKSINLTGQAPLREHLEREIIIGTIANLYKTKGLEYLIEAIKILTTYNLQLTTIIIGEGEERENLEDLIGQLNLKNRVFLLGNIKNAAELLPAFDIYANSSVKEGFPYSILEAMSAGLPIVATRVGGVPEMIDDPSVSSGQANGFLVNLGDPQALAEKIKILIEDENLRKVLGEQAKQKVEKEFKMEKMIGEIKNIYAFNDKAPLLTKERRG